MTTWRQHETHRVVRAQWRRPRGRAPQRRGHRMHEEERNQLTGIIIGAAIAVHRALGPGLLESTYEACLVYELRQRGLEVEQQKSEPLVYKGVQLECGYRLDLLVAGEVVVEVKAVEHIHPTHRAQLLSYLKLTGHKIGLLINFNVRILKDGIHRYVN